MDSLSAAAQDVITRGMPLAKAASQLEERRSAGFPPYSYQVMLRAEAPGLDVALQIAPPIPPPA